MKYFQCLLSKALSSESASEHPEISSTNAKHRLKEKKGNSGIYNYRMFIFKVCTSSKQVLYSSCIQSLTFFPLSRIIILYPSATKREANRSEKCMNTCVEELAVWSLGDSRIAKSKLKLSMTEWEQKRFVRSWFFWFLFFFLQTKAFLWERLLL